MVAYAAIFFALNNLLMLMIFYGDALFNSYGHKAMPVLALSMFNLWSNILS
jgi:hypothetical protein